MAATVPTHFPSSILFPRLSLHRHRVTEFPFPTQSRLSLRTRAAAGPDLLGDFGARDPFPQELESNFAEKVLGNVDTEHKILIPNVSALSLAKQDCAPIPPLQPPMSIDDAQKLLKKVSFSFNRSLLFINFLEIDLKFEIDR